MTRVMIGVPSHETVSIRFTIDLAQLYVYSSARLLGAVDLNTVIGTYVHDARERLATEAIRAGFSHVLWIDADMRFPEDALIRLLRHDLSAVGINYSTREAPSRFTATRADGTCHLVTDAEAAGVEEVAALGFGLLLMRTDVLTAMERPWFRYDWIPEGGVWRGEDYSFCERARAVGVSFSVDHDLSKECAHIGAYEYRTEHAVPQMEYTEHTS